MVELFAAVHKHLIVLRLMILCVIIENVTIVHDRLILHVDEEQHDEVRRHDDKHLDDLDEHEGHIIPVRMIREIQSIQHWIVCLKCK